jgi:hypothetical protein
MNRIFLLILLSIFFGVSTTSQAQNNDSLKAVVAKGFVVKGNIKDTLNFTNSGYGSVSLIRASDSILQSFTRTDENGDFSLKVDSPSAYLLLIAHPAFATYIESVNVKNALTTMEPIIMTSKKQMLSEVIITDAKAIVLKGDTIVYTADSFKTAQFANVDDLLKKLPGIEIDKDGKIKAYGQEVKKMTVDGEEFFSDDPAIVSKTLRASSIDKVQVFDKKNDQVNFSGVDDGERIKTINLQLKDDAKRGYFGKTQASGGLPNYWQNEAMVNAFKGKRKVAAYGIMSNTATNGLGWDDERKYSGSEGFQSDEEGIVFINRSEDDDQDWNGQFQGTGLPKAWVAGGLYNNKWHGDSLTLSSNYSFSKKMSESEGNVSSEYILPDTQYFNTQHSDKRTITIRNGINTTTEYLIDTSSSIKVALNGGYNTSHNLSRTQSKSADRNGTLINENDASQEDEKSMSRLNTDIFYKKRFAKKGRSFTADLTGKWAQTKGDGTLQSAYSLVALDSNYVLNQRKQNNSSSGAGVLKITYTEPLSKAFNLLFNYSYGLNISEASNNTYDKQADNVLYSDVFNPNYSSHFKMKVSQNQAGIGIRYNTKKINASIGSNISDTRYTQEDKLYDTTYHFNYLNLLPTASFRYNKSQTTSISFKYSGKSQQPSLTQLQPYRNNNDPLNITLGNPDLKQSFIHDLSVNYNSYKMLSQQYIYGYGGVKFMEHDITLKQYIDNSGRSVNQYVNVDGDYQPYLYSGWGRKIKDFNVGLGLNMSYSHKNNYVNNLPNANNLLTLSPSTGLGYSRDTTWDISYSFIPEYNLNKSSIRSDVVTKYWAFNQSLRMSVLLPYRFKIGTDISLNLRQKLNPLETNNNVMLWNGYISRSFLKDKSLEAKMYVNDLLNQNAGYSRYNTATMISESNYNTIKRYVMFSLTWNFTKTGGKAQGESASGDDIK